MLIDNRISYFNTIINPEEISPYLGHFGEWFFAGCFKQVYQIRTDDLRSQEGIEVLKTKQNQIVNGNRNQNLLRVAAIITVIPAVVALLDKVLFRLIYQRNMHLNRLPNIWRKEQNGVLFGLERAANGFLPEFKDYKVNSTDIYISQPHSWNSPCFQVVHINEQHQVNQILATGLLKEDEKTVALDVYVKPTPGVINFFSKPYNGLFEAENPQQIFDYFREDDTFMITAPESKPPTDVQSQIIQQSSYYRGVCSSIQHFYNAFSAEKEFQAIFYDQREDKYCIAIKLSNDNFTCHTLTYSDDGFESNFVSRGKKNSSLEALMKEMQEHVVKYWQ